MKIEIKPQDFRDLVEWLKEQVVPAEISLIINNTLEPAYHKAFKKYQEEVQKYQVGEVVRWRRPRRAWFDGVIFAVVRRQNGKYYYTIEYRQRGSQSHSYSNPLTQKNIKKV